MTSRVRFSHSSMTAYELVQMLNSGQLRIPPHQRNFCWPMRRQQEFIDTILQNIPTQAIIIRRESRSSAIESLEDGRQRLTTVDEFMKDKVTTKDGRKYSELTDDQKMEFRSYIFAVTIYHNATPEQVIMIFDRYQNGIVLSIGERLHSMSEISPLIRIAKKWFLSSEEEHYPRIRRIFGNLVEKKDVRHQMLVNAVMIAGGILFGTRAITKKWQEIQDEQILTPPISDASERAGFAMLNDILETYEAVDDIETITSKEKNKFWNVGHFTGYLIHSFHERSHEIDELKDEWVECINQIRDASLDIKETLHKDLGAARQFTPHRFKMGYLRIFDPDEANRLASGSGGSDVSEESDADTE